MGMGFNVGFHARSKSKPNYQQAFKMQTHIGRLPKAMVLRRVGDLNFSVVEICIRMWRAAAAATARLTTTPSGTRPTTPARRCCGHGRGVGDHTRVLGDRKWRLR
jgi:hypothetical protein